MTDREIYNKARKRVTNYTNGTPSDEQVIVHLEQEIDRYRAKLVQAESERKGLIACPSGTEGIISKVLEILHIPCNGVDIEIHAKRDEVSTIDYHIYGIYTK